MRLPPFSSLVALEAAARHKSYSRAAEELFVTHGAVSQQVRKLEEELGVQLFTRRGNQMEPTATGAALAARVGEAITTLRQGVDGARRAASGPIVISTGAAFATRWLVTQLARLSAETGELDLTIRVEDRMSDLATDGADVALRFGEGPWPGVDSARLIDEVLFPVCSPALLERYRIEKPEDLLSAPLLRHTGLPWAIWFRAMGVEPPELPPALGFDDSSMMLDAAAQGLGVALARSGIARRDLGDGRLVRPLPGEVDVKTGHHFVWRAENPKLPRILKLRDWFLKETQGERAR
ncbi:LysR substrate-binding domain-containing protein [Caulobacter segnis]|uniref:LysR substrate-binding domain-containing protein n=1 Tax=Caulobacter segnis TaxID=88688 RepID=UPI001CBB1037|nr:LysR substrate-binding domain-containing protein [Caulobacter segnis]UAL12986.1 LysR family transcriptional regulator [Caulobacter segnis]